MRTGQDPEPMTAATPPYVTPASPKSGLQLLGPGLITGASDDDPSGIATYSQAGAQFGFALGWTLVFTFPLMAAIQEISARIGRVTGKGLAGNIRLFAPTWLLHTIVVLLIVTNMINVAADLSAMAAAIHLLVGGPLFLYTGLFTAASLGAQVFIGYERYARVLKWLALSLLAYVATAFIVKMPWGQVLRGIVLPSLDFSPVFFTTVVAIFGTTISPYLFFWQASEEVEEQQKQGEASLKEDARPARQEFRRIRIDTLVGMGLSNIVALFIMITAAATLHTTGGKEIASAADAAEALRPIAGDMAFVIFAIGIIGTGLLAVPVLAGASAYALGEARQWRVGLNEPWRKARKFYGVIAGVMVGALALNVIEIDPMKALFWSAVLNGIMAVPVMVMMMLMATSRAMMGRFALTPTLKALGWVATAVMGAAAILMMVLGG
jgi:NRAMP (natural resistance-associated macrophage protein)-like metal ion transporter